MSCVLRMEAINDINIQKGSLVFEGHCCQDRNECIQSPLDRDTDMPEECGQNQLLAAVCLAHEPDEAATSGALA